MRHRSPSRRSRHAPRALLVALLALLVGAAAARAQDENDVVKDPVCGMTIKKGDAAAMSPYQGQDYFFCMKDCQNDFLGEPAKYTGWVATSKKAHGYFVNLFSKPGKVTAGEYSRLFLELVPETGTTAKVLTVKGSMVLNFQLGDKPMKKKYDNVDMQPMKEPGFCGTRMAFLNDGYCDAKFTLQFDDGTEEQVPFRFDVLPNWDKAVGTEYGVPSKMKMAVQHHVVRKLGRFWTDVHDELGNATPDWDKALDFLGRVQAYQKYLPSFVPHKHTKETEEWRKLVDEFGASLAELRKAMEAKDAAASRTLHARIEAENCTRCHLKFRWDTHSDVTNLRDLRGKQTE